MWLASLFVFATVPGACLATAPLRLQQNEVELTTAAHGLVLLARRSKIGLREKRSSPIPSILLFNHKRNLMGFSDKDPMDSLTKLLRNNVLHIIQTFRQAVEPRQPQVMFWDNAQCVVGLKSLPSEFKGDELAWYFEQEFIGMIKSDLCRLAMIYQHGGYYFDTDILPVVHMRNHIDKDTTFATVVAYGGDSLFQAFMAASPKHPLIAESLRDFLTWYRQLNQIGVDQLKFRQAAAGGNIGTFILNQAYKTWAGTPDHLERVDHGNGHVSQFFVEGNFSQFRESVPDLIPDAPIKIQLCNYAVVENSTKTVLMYSRIYDSRDRKACKEEQSLLNALSSETPRTEV